MSEEKIGSFDVGNNAVAIALAAIITGVLVHFECNALAAGWGLFAVSGQLHSLRKTVERGR